MELEKFDDLTRTFTAPSTRRRFGGLLTALGLGTVAGLGLLGAADTDAKKRHKRHKRHKHNKHNKHNKQYDDGDDGNNGGDPTCVPDCVGPFGPKACGPDGCGGTCGQCPLFLPICNPILFTCEAIDIFP